VTNGLNFERGGIGRLLIPELMLHAYVAHTEELPYSMVLLSIINNNNEDTFVANLYRNIFLTGFLLLSVNSWSSGALTQHAVTTNKAISAFYMYTLTEGDERYHDEYVKILEEANMSFLALKSQHPEQVVALEPLWDKIQKEKGFKASAQDEYNVPSYLRVQFRSYIEKIYQVVSQSIISDSNINGHMGRIALDVEVMSVRFFDVSSSTMGAMVSSSTDPETMANSMKMRLTKLQGIVTDPKITKNLRSIANKWRFIESSVIHYNQESAFMLVYYNKNKIGKLINSSQRKIASL
jgi:hypothetical protein